MPKVERSHWLPYPQEVVYNTLADVTVLPSVIKRIQKIDVIHRQENEGQVRVTLDIPFHKLTESTGYVRGIPQEKLFFSTESPFPMQFAWTLIPREKNGQMGTEVWGSMELDLSAFVPGFSNFMVEALLASELDADLKRLESWLKNGESSR